MSARTMQPEDTVAEDWLARLMAPDCSAAERAAFEDWLAQSPRNVEAFVEVERVHALAAELRSDELLRAAGRAARRAPASSPAPAPVRHARAWWSAAAAAAVVAVVAVAMVLPWGQHEAPAQIQHFATALGEQRDVTLADGTVMRLDTASTLTTRFDGRERVVELRRGRAQFDVGEDARRPFLVKAGVSTVRDIGTTFQVSRMGEVVNVGLLEGRVDVSSRAGGAVQRSTLAPGEQVTVQADGRIGERAPLDVAMARAWPQGDLVFRQRRLDELVAEMNRYSPRQIRLADAALGSLRVSGVFHAGDQDALVAVLERGWPLRAERTGEHEIVLHARD
ncbi:FecR domain-containing protein [Lysobacter sp. LF1]|uniref:FecR domain-containing protein n=1 Tax=Lysobacter stagni TaxID=3045172 RepID=A0ABT6XJY7_9GAMM|nr:FecR domain-containing protein [Lysobacter sp. LF1]MDI9240479.1 FecR domain-containing protein [Lysobacter sp. LF1]